MEERGADQAGRQTRQTGHRERERDRDRQTERQTETETEQVGENLLRDHRVKKAITRQAADP